MKGYSSAGRITVSKTAGRGFESYCPWQRRNQESLVLFLCEKQMPTMEACFKILKLNKILAFFGKSIYTIFVCAEFVIPDKVKDLKILNITFFVTLRMTELGFMRSLIF